MQPSSASQPLYCIVGWLSLTVLCLRHIGRWLRISAYFILSCLVLKIYVYIIKGAIFDRRVQKFMICWSLGLLRDCQYYGRSVNGKRAWHLCCAVLGRLLSDKCLQLTGMLLQNIPGRLSQCEPLQQCEAFAASVIECELFDLTSVWSHAQRINVYFHSSIPPWRRG